MAAGILWKRKCVERPEKKDILIQNNLISKKFVCFLGLLTCKDRKCYSAFKKAK